MKEPTSPRAGYFLFILIKLISGSFDIDKFPDRVWTCESGSCVPGLSIPGRNIQAYYNLDGCKTICGEHGSLWPKPSKSKIGSSLECFDPAKIQLEISTPYSVDGDPDPFTRFVQNSWRIFLENSVGKRRKEMEIDGRGGKLRVTIKVRRRNLDLSLETDESYGIEIMATKNKDKAVVIGVLVSGVTVFGARHGLETLSQFISYDERRKCFQIAIEALVEDAPVYPYRGLLLDTSRNYFSVDSIKRIIDGMSYDKLNVFHWHIIDQQSFPFVSHRVPNLTYFGAYSKNQLYHPEDVKTLVLYGKQRGIMILPEFDAPAHASTGWRFGEDSGLGKLVTCRRKEWSDGVSNLAAEPPSGQLNPANPNVYKILGELYKDLLEAFNSKEVGMFHMGGDEVNFRCWSEEPDIQQWLRERNLKPEEDGFLNLWSYFQEKARLKLTESNQKSEIDQLILWTSEFTKGDKIERFLNNSKYTVQLWTTGTDFWISELLQKKFRVIFSNYDAWYLDCGFGAWLPMNNDESWCSPFKSWRIIYSNSPKQITLNFGFDWKHVKHLVQGGEVTMWSEQADEHGVEGKIWPRTSAFAERIWSEPNTTWESAEQRLLQHRHRIVERGIRADAMQPEFCRTHDGWCYYKSAAPNIVAILAKQFGTGPRSMEDWAGSGPVIGRADTPAASPFRSDAEVSESRRRRPSHSYKEEFEPTRARRLHENPSSATRREDEEDSTKMYYISFLFIVGMIFFITYRKRFFFLRKRIY